MITLKQQLFDLSTKLSSSSAVATVRQYITDGESDKAIELLSKLPQTTFASAKAKSEMLELLTTHELPVEVAETVEYVDDATDVNGNEIQVEPLEPLEAVEEQVEEPATEEDLIDELTAEVQEEYPKASKKSKGKKQK